MYGPEGRPPNVSQARESLCENSTYPRGWENPVPHFPWAAAANEKRHIDSHYPTQAKGRLEWGTQHFLPVWQILGRTRWTHFRIGRFSCRAV